MPISLLLRGPEGTERRLDFDRGKVTLGADPLCDITIPDEGVDAEQAVLVQRGEAVELFDIGESGGVLVNGRPVGHAVLGPTDEVWIGKCVLRLATASAGVSITEAVTTVRAALPSAPVAAPGPSRSEPVRPVAESDRRNILLNEVGRLINSIGRNENIFESILDTVFATVHVRRAFIGLNDAKGALQVKAHRNRETGTESGPIEVSRTLIGKVLGSGQAVLTTDAEADPDFSAARSIHRLRIKAAVCVPLVADAKVIGLLYGDNRERPGSLTQEDLAMLNALAGVAAVAVEKFRLLAEYDAKVKIEQALSIARSIQRNFLPAAPPALPGLDIWGRSDSCDETGGDYFDYFPMSEGRLGVVIADVTGHGIGPALLMASVRAALRTILGSDERIEDLLFNLNNLVRADVRDGRFVTLFFALIDRERGTIRYAGAGHTPPILFRASDRSTTLLPNGGPPLGILKGLRYREGATLPFRPGDLLLLTTDAIIEAARGDGEAFGLPRLRAIVTEGAGKSARELVEDVRGAVDRYVDYHPLRDDATLVAIKML